MTHTSGTWTVPKPVSGEDVTVTGYTPVHKNPVSVARVYGPGALSKATEERDANAALITAAPELLKALQWAMVYLPRFPLPAYDEELRDIFAENLEFCQAAIAKAEGRV